MALDDRNGAVAGPLTANWAWMQGRSLTLFCSIAAWGTDKTKAFGYASPLARCFAALARAGPAAGVFLHGPGNLP